MNIQEEMTIIVDLLGFTVRTIILVILIPLWFPVWFIVKLVQKEILRYKERKIWSKLSQK